MWAPGLNWEIRRVEVPFDLWEKNRNTENTEGTEDCGGG